MATQILGPSKLPLTTIANELEISPIELLMTTLTIVMCKSTKTPIARRTVMRTLTGKTRDREWEIGSSSSSTSKSWPAMMDGKPSFAPKPLITRGAEYCTWLKVNRKLTDITTLTTSKITKRTILTCTSWANNRIRDDRSRVAVTLRAPFSPILSLGVPTSNTQSFQVFWSNIPPPEPRTFSRSCFWKLAKQKLLGHTHTHTHLYLYLHHCLIQVTWSRSCSLIKVTWSHIFSKGGKARPRVYKHPRVRNSAYQVSDVKNSHHVIRIRCTCLKYR